MKALGAVFAGIFVFFLVGHLTGHAPRMTFGKKRRPQTSEQQLWITQAGLDVTPRQFWAVSVFMGLVAFAVFSIITGSAPIAFVPALSVALLPRAYFARRRVKRLRTVQEAWPDAIREIISSIEANMSLGSAITELARSGPEALRQTLARFPQTAATLGVVPALEIIREELADPASDRIIEVLILAHERGGATVTQILRELAAGTTQDVRVLAEIETNALEQKINARAVFVLPWFTLIFMTMSGGAFREFYQSPAGLLVVIVGVLLSAAGMFWVSRLGREPVERRVFGSSATQARRAL